jgi:hypothetical protein
MDATNWINLGLLVVTALVGILAWMGARRSAREAHNSQMEAVEEAKRSAHASEVANTIHARMVELEEQRQTEYNTESRRAILRAEYTEESRDFLFMSYLIISNEGMETARNIEITLGDKPFLHYHVPKLTESRPVSAVTVGPGAHVKLFCSQQVLPARCALEWDDDSGRRGRWTHTLTSPT